MVLEKLGLVGRKVHQLIVEERDMLLEQVSRLRGARIMDAETIRDLERQVNELRPDAEWARNRKAKAAEYEASKRVRKGATR